MSGGWLLLGQARWASACRLHGGGREDGCEAKLNGPTGILFSTCAIIDGVEIFSK